MPAESNSRRLNASDDGNSARARSYQAYQALRQGSGNNDNRNSFEQFRRRNSSDESAGSSTPQLRSFNDLQPSGGSGRSFSRNRTTTETLNSDQLRALLNQRRGRSSDSSQAGSSAARQLRQLDWNARRNDPSNSAGSGGQADGNNVRGRGGNQALEQALRNRNRLNDLSGSADNERSSRRNGNRFADGGNLSGNDGPQRAFRNQLGGSNDRNNNGEFARRDRWSKDSDVVSDRTRRWFSNSGFGDHRDRSNRHDDHDGDFADNVRKNWRNNWKNHWRDDDDHRHLPFAASWWNGHRRSPYYVYWRDDRWRRDPYFWWQPCTAPLLTTWVSFGWYEPCYWDYGPGEYVYYRDNYVYVDGQPYGTALEYYAQVRGLAQSVPALSPEQWGGIDWLPLGVFAVNRAGGATSQEIIQLAVSADGILSGTFFDQRTGTARPLKGRVDQATQRAAWVLADDPASAVVIETSLYNLTEPECTALAHLGPVTTEVLRLVRLDQPTEPGLPAGEPLLPAPAQ